MKLIRISNFGETEEVVSEKASLNEVISLVDALNWQHFHQVVLQKDSENWIEVGGSLNTHGLAAVICHDNEHFVIATAPASIGEMKRILTLYLQGDKRITEDYYFPGLSKPLPKRTSLEAVLKEEKQRLRRRVLAAVILFVVIGLIVYNLNEQSKLLGKPTELGQRVSTAQAEEHIFGLMLFNDWSARDIQKWEYVPLGPFLSKSFASTVSPWVITLDALEPFRVEGPTQDPEVLPYLQYNGAKNYNIDLEVLIQPEAGEANLVCRSNFRYMYWNMCQQLAHHTVNGCNLNVGDMCASGTISGSTEDSYGSMLELTWRGSKPMKLSDGSERKFINDGDTVIMRGHAERDGVRIGFGEARATVLPAE